MSDFAPKQRPVSRTRIARASASRPTQAHSLHSIIGNQAMQRLLQRDTEAEAAAPMGFSALQASVIQAVNTLGGAVTADYVAKATDSLPTAVLKIGLRSHRVLPATATIQSQVAQGQVQPGTLEGAGQLVYIKVQSLPGQSRVTCKLVNVETSEIQATGKHDFASSPQAMTDAVMHALVQMGVPWVKSSEPYSGRSSEPYSGRSSEPYSGRSKDM